MHGSPIGYHVAVTMLAAVWICTLGSFFSPGGAACGLPGAVSSSSLVPLLPFLPLATPPPSSQRDCHRNMDQPSSSHCINSLVAFSPFPSWLLFFTCPVRRARRWLSQAFLRSTHVDLPDVPPDSSCLWGSLPSPPAAPEPHVAGSLHPSSTPFLFRAPLPEGATASMPCIALVTL